MNAADEQWLEWRLAAAPVVRTSSTCIAVNGSPMKPAYHPSTEPIPGRPGLYEQVFVADEFAVEIGKEAVLFGAADESHSLLVSWPADASQCRSGALTPEEVCVEFNDQGNSCSGAHMESVEVDPTQILVTLRPQSGLVVSRVSYDLEADSFSGPCQFPDMAVGRIVARIQIPTAKRQQLRSALRHLASIGCSVVDRLAYGHE